MLTYFEEGKKLPKRLDAMFIAPDDKEGGHYHGFPTREDMRRGFYE